MKNLERKLLSHETSRSRCCWCCCCCCYCTIACNWLLVFAKMQKPLIKIFQERFHSSKELRKLLDNYVETMANIYASNNWPWDFEKKFQPNGMFGNKTWKILNLVFVSGRSIACATISIRCLPRDHIFHPLDEYQQVLKTLNLGETITFFIYISWRVLMMAI